MVKTSLKSFEVTGLLGCSILSPSGRAEVIHGQSPLSIRREHQTPSEHAPKPSSLNSVLRKKNQKEILASRTKQEGIKSPRHAPQGTLVLRDALLVQISGL